MVSSRAVGAFLASLSLEKVGDGVLPGGFLRLLLLFLLLPLGFSGELDVVVDVADELAALLVVDGLESL